MQGHTALRAVKVLRVGRGQTGLAPQAELALPALTWRCLAAA